MHRTIRLSLVLVVAALGRGAAADLITQSGVHTTTFSGFNGLASQSVPWGSDANAVSTMNPFNPAVGTLDSVTVQWVFGGTMNGTTGASGGNATYGISGSFLVNGASFSGYGSGGGGGAGPSSPISVTQPDSTSSQTFTAAGAGVTYDPAIWAAFTGNVPYSVTMASTGNYLTYNGIVSGTATTHRDVTVTYTYTASPVPEIDPASAGGVLPLVTGALALLERRRRARG